MRERDLFIEVLQKESSEARLNCLDAACAGDVELRRRVERLLEEHARQEDFILDAPPPGFEPTLLGSVNEQPGMQIGPYKLLQQIGEGGFGVVLMAEQMGPIRRKVALKIIKPGMDTKQVIARFEVERQALAMMDHPNIARVFDAGSTDSGRPYFVMELVHGVPITE
jgi:serine/threonine protein kinase